MSEINIKRKSIKTQIIQKNQAHTNDTGSIQLQIALCKHKLYSLQSHQTKHPKDVTILRVITSLKSKIAKFNKYLTQ